MRYLSSANVDAAREALENDLPGFQVKSIRLDKQGWVNYTFLVNDEFIFRFPKDGDVQTHQERWALRALQGVSTLPFPTLEFEGKEIHFIGYRYLPGVQLAEVWRTFTNEGIRRTTNLLVEFFAVMHRSLDIHDAMAHGLVPEVKMYTHARQALETKGEWFEEARQALDRLSVPSPGDVVLHNDLHTENILIDPETKEISAILDLGDVAIGDPSIDLNYLLEVDLGLADFVSERYRHYGGANVPAQRLSDIYFMQTLDEYLGPDMPDSERIRMKEMLEEYMAFIST